MLDLKAKSKRYPGCDLEELYECPVCEAWWTYTGTTVNIEKPNRYKTCPQCPQYRYGEHKWSVGGNL